MSVESKSRLWQRRHVNGRVASDTSAVPHEEIHYPSSQREVLKSGMRRRNKIPLAFTRRLEKRSTLKYECTSSLQNYQAKRLSLLLCANFDELSHISHNTKQNHRKLSKHIRACRALTWLPFVPGMSSKSMLRKPSITFGSIRSWHWRAEPYKHKLRILMFLIIPCHSKFMKSNFVQTRNRSPCG